MPARIQEVRILTGTTLNTAFTAASNAAWAIGTADVMAHTGTDVSGCKRLAIESEVRQRNLGGAPANIPAQQENPIALSLYLGRGSSDTTPPFMATLLSKILGGLKSPTAKTDLCEADCTATLINATAHGLAVGDTVLISGEARRVATVPDADSYTFEMALSAAPATSTAIVHGHTVFFDPSTTQEYIDLLGIGWHAEDQWQAIAAMGGFTFTGLGHGEIPGVTINLNAGQFQMVPSGERDQLEPSQAQVGEDGPAGKEHGGFFLGDHGATTRLAAASSDWALDPGLVYESTENRYFENAMGAWKKMSFRPTFGATILVEQDTEGLIADMDARTAKQLSYQFGSTAENCCAIFFPKAYFDMGPAKADMGNFAGLRIEGHGEQQTVAATISYLGSCNMSIAWF